MAQRSPPKSGAGDVVGTGSAPDLGGRVHCVHADRCGGCPIIALAYEEQLELKRGRVVQSASRYPTLELVFTEGVLPALPTVGYRTRAKLIVGSGGKLGLYAKGGGHQVVDIPDCRVLSPALAEIASLVRVALRADEATGGVLAALDGGAGALRAVDLREVEGDEGRRVLVTFVVQRSHVSDRGALEAAVRSFVAASPLVIGAALNFHDGESPQILGSETVVVAGVQAAADTIGDARHLATYGSFVQAHRGQAARVHALLAAALELRSAEAPRRVLDLYGGSGAIALSLAAAGADVHLVEAFAPAAAQVERAAREQRLSVRAEGTDVASALRRVLEQQARYDAAVVNPPRRGMSPLARELLARTEVPAIAYVSCDPDTLARDLDHLTRLGYAVATLNPLDMIPLTDEVETVAVLRRVGVPTPRVAYEDDDVLVAEKGAHEPVSPQGEYATCLLARVRRLSSAREAIPVHRIDVGTSGLVVFVKRAPDLARWQAAFAAESTRRIYLAGARGVTPTKGAITRDLREDGRMYPARTRYRRLAVASGHSVLRVVPEQNRTHQIRRHLAAIGHPLLGDERYGHAPTNRFFEEKNALDRTFLHCVRLEFDHPDGGRRMIVEAALPGDLRAVLERTSGPGTLRFLEQKNALGRTGASTAPPPPDASQEHEVAIDVDASTPSIRPEIVTDDDTGGRNDDGF